MGFFDVFKDEFLPTLSAGVLNDFRFQVAGVTLPGGRRENIFVFGHVQNRIKRNQWVHLVEIHLIWLVLAATESIDGPCRTHHNLIQEKTPQNDILQDPENRLKMRKKKKKRQTMRRMEITP